MHPSIENYPLLQSQTPNPKFHEMHCCKLCRGWLILVVLVSCISDYLVSCCGSVVAVHSIASCIAGSKCLESGFITISIMLAHPQKQNLFHLLICGNGIVTVYFTCKDAVNYWTDQMCVFLVLRDDLQHDGPGVCRPSIQIANNLCAPAFLHLKKSLPAPFYKHFVMISVII